MNSNITIHKPTPIEPDTGVIPFNTTTDVARVIEALEANERVLITEFYSNGIQLLKEIQKHLKRKTFNNTFKEQRAYRSAYHELSNRILIEIVHHELAVKKGPDIGWLKKLYPETGNFLLPFPQVQGLNSSWQWYKNGISLPVLRNKIHPYYGVYFPTRFDHLILFDNWLKRYEGLKKEAIEVGVGCGVLSFQMLKYGFQKVFGTDINPNAIVGLQEFMGDTKLSRKIELDLGQLFGRWNQRVELIVFNPPWLPHSQQIEGMDKAIYYDKNLFPDFFEAAKKHLLPDGKLVLLFSNLAKITDVATKHPIEEELRNGRRFQLERCFKKRVKDASENSKRDAYWRSSEEVELWVLTHQ